MKLSINQSFNQSFDQSINQSIGWLINQSINKITLFFYKHIPFFSWASACLIFSIFQPEMCLAVCLFLFDIRIYQIVEIILTTNKWIRFVKEKSTFIVFLEKNGIVFLKILKLHLFYKEISRNSEKLPWNWVKITLLNKIPQFF